MVNAAFYIIYVLTFFIFQYIPKSIGKAEKYYYPRFYIILSLFFVMGCRGFIVTDWVNYYQFYQRIPTFYDSNIIEWVMGYPWEKGFVFLSCLIKTFTSNYFIYQFILFLFDFLILDKIIREYVKEEYYCIAYISFFVFGGVTMIPNLLRNMKAILLFLFSIRYIQDRKFLKFFLIILFATLFHTSAVFYLPMYFVLRHKFSKKTLLILFFIGNIIFLTHFSWLLAIMKIILPILGQSRLALMVEQYQILSGEASSYALGFGFIERNLVYLLVVKYQDKILKNDERLLPFINMLYLFAFCFLFLSEFSIIANRLSKLFIASYWIIIPAIYAEIKTKDWKHIFIISMIIYSILKLLLQCHEPYYRYTNALINTPNYEHSKYILENAESKEK